MNILLEKLVRKLLRYQCVYVQKIIKEIEDCMFFLLFKVKRQCSIDLFSWSRSYKTYRIKVVELLMSFKTTYGRIFCDKKLTILWKFEFLKILKMIVFLMDTWEPSHSICVKFFLLAYTSQLIRVVKFFLLTCHIS